MRFNSILSIVLIAYSSTLYASTSHANTPLNSGVLLCDAIPIIVDAPEIMGDNSFASPEPNEPLGSCWWVANPLNSIWYSFVAPSSGKASVSTSFENTSLGDTHIAIYDVGDCADMTTLTELACDEDSGVLFTSFATTTDLTPGKTYYIQVDGYQDNVGTFKIKVSELPGCTGISSPMDGASNVPLNKIVTWNPIVGMTNYTITISAPLGANNIILNSNLGNTNTYTPPQPWSPNTTYLVQITAWNAQNDTISCPPSNFTTTTATVQTIGPGGITIHNTFWTKANQGVLYSGAIVSEWKDQSMGSNHALQQDTSSQPSFHPSIHNYNPSIYFDGNNDHLAIPNLITANSKNISVIAVGTNEQGGDSWHSMVFGQSNSTWSNGGYGICGLDNATNSFGFWINSWSTNSIATPLIPNRTTILEGKYEENKISFFKDGHLEGTTPYNGEIGDSGSTYLGGGEASNHNHKGYISEVIIYNNELAENDWNKINSYLAIKYGITLSRNEINQTYVNSNNENIYSSDSTFWQNIIGIGRDDNTALLQKQSHQLDDSTRLYLAELTSTNTNNQGVYSSDNQFIVIGNNGNSIASTLPNDSPIGTSRITSREWKIQNTNFTGNFTLEILLSECAIRNINNIRLLISNSSDFSTAQVHHQSNGLQISKNGGWLKISGISNNHISQNSTAYIALASTQETQTINHFSQTLCAGSSLTINGTLYNETNPSGTEILTSSIGCDSLVEINLIFKNELFINLNQTLCNRDSIIINGTVYSAQNPTGIETLTSIYGCDSIINIDLTFNGNIQSTFNPSVCFGDSVSVNGTTYDELNPTGIEMLTTDLGCDSAVHIELVFYSEFPELEEDVFNLTNTDAQEISLIFNDYLPENWAIFTLNTNHPDWFQLKTDGTLVLQPHKNNSDDILTIEYIICNSICSNLCDTTNVTIRYKLTPKNEPIVSDVLTLNGDGKNDRLVFKNLNTLTNQGIKIFNRWGNLVFAEAPYQNTWDGKNKNNQALPNGTYYYILSILNANGQTVQGDVLLIR